MLFRKDIAKCCGYCQCAEIQKNGSLKCRKKGTVDEDQSCWFFRYDPCKRIPVKAKIPDFSQYKEEDFTL